MSKLIGKPCLDGLELDNITLIRCIQRFLQGHCIVWTCASLKSI